MALLVTDLDNTLWDWFAAWYGSFSAMLTKLAELSGVAQDVLESEIHAVHQQRGTSEYTYLLNELPSLRVSADGREPMAVYDEAIHVQNSQRKRVTKLYPGVRETLVALRGRGVCVVAYTESLAYWTEWRIRHTGLDGLIDALYSSPDHDLPDGVSFDALRTQSAAAYGLRKTEHRHVPQGVLKPSDEILRSILKNTGCTPEETVYVGDSLMKDVAMAQSVGVWDVHAAYGQPQSRPEYDLLRRVSHWPDVDVARERDLMKTDEIKPTVTLKTGFPELLTNFDFGRTQ